jgi:hypothetical protein
MVALPSLFGVISSFNRKKGQGIMGNAVSIDMLESKRGPS